MRAVERKGGRAVSNLARTAGILGLVAALFTALPPDRLTAQGAPLPPAAPAYAITNATIVPVVGDRIARGTVVIRDGRITAAQSADVLAVFSQAVSTWAILEISEEVARRAEDVFPNEPVRTLDAIHLASALFLRQSFPDLVVVSAEKPVFLGIAIWKFGIIGKMIPE